MYGLSEKAFRRVYDEAARRKGVTGTEMLVSLERRLDNIAYRLGFGISRAAARQLVGHGHVMVNGKRVTLPSYLVSVGDVVEVGEKAKGAVAVKAALASTESRLVPTWLSIDRAGAKGSVIGLPTRDQISSSINEQLVVERYSR
jgi:small subunit ribosomal protein S4